MKRDMDLVRKILLSLEQHPNGFPPDDFKVDDCSEDQLGYHVYIMGQAGLLEVVDVTNTGSSGPEARIKSLTWSGHEFAESAREPKRWAEAKEVLNRVGGASFEVWASVLKELVTKSLGL